MVGGFDFWGEGPLVGAKFPAGAAHGWWEGGKVLAALSSVTKRRALFPFPDCVQSFHQSVCAAVQTAGPPRWKLFSALIRSGQYKYSSDYKLPLLKFKSTAVPTWTPFGA